MGKVACKVLSKAERIGKKVANEESLESSLLPTIAGTHNNSLTVEKMLRHPKRKAEETKPVRVGKLALGRLTNGHVRLPVGTAIAKNWIGRAFPMVCQAPQTVYSIAVRL
jgi:hypothetical protein